MDDLTKRSKKTKEQAERILRESRLAEILSKHGQVKFSGSYPLNVMLRPDLDVYVLAQEHDVAKLTSIISKIIKQNYFQEIDFADWLNFPGGPWEGYYLQPHIKVDEVRWKLDIWLIKQEIYQPYTEEFQRLLENTPEKRQIILQIKNDLKEGSKYIKGVNGRDIYEAVLKHGIQNSQDFLKHIHGKK